LIDYFCEYEKKPQASEARGFFFDHSSFSSDSMELDRRFTMDILPLTLKESLFELYGARSYFYYFYYWRGPPRPLIPFYHEAVCGAEQPFTAFFYS
jgi:hypothetical protein